MIATAMVTRRAALARMAGVLVPGVLVAQDTAPDSTVAPQLFRPDYAGRSRARVTDYENDPFIVGVEGQLRCTCGCNLDVYTCRTTDFTCSVSPAMHREVVALVEGGKTGEEILEAFVARYGETVLMAPRKQGFNLAAYVVPGLAISIVGAILLWVLARRTTRASIIAAADVDPGLSDEEQSLLHEELQHLGR